MSESLEKIKRIRALAEMGLVYSNNHFDTERYEELKDISTALISEVSNEPIKALEDFYLPTDDYPTPKVDIRGLVLNDKNEILMVQEPADNCWALPGGWGDVGFSPSEVIIKEIEEETGLEARTERVLAVYDKRCHPHPPQPFYVYKIVFHCKTISGTLTKTKDVLDSGFFALNDLPPISEDRILKSQIEQLYQKVIENDYSVYYD